MNIRTFSWILFFIGTVACSWFQNIQSGSIDTTVSLGEFVDIGRDVIIKPYSEIGSFSSIAPNTVIEEHSKIGGFTHIGSQCLIGNWVNIQEYASIGNSISIGPGSLLRNYCSVGNNGKIGNRVKLNQYSSVADYAEIGDNSILSMYSSVGYNAKLHPRACVGMYSSIGPNAIVGDSAVIYNFVELLNGVVVKPNQAVIRTPSTFELIQKCNPTVSSELARVAANTMNGAISPEFNDMLRRAIDDELNKLSSNCIEMNTPTKPQSLPQIITLYLVQFYGPELFNQYVQKVKQTCNLSRSGLPNVNSVNVNGQSIVIINGVRVDTSPPDPLMWQLQNEYHFGGNSTRNILEPDVKRKLIELLTIDQDAERDNENRVEGDSYCTTVGQIRNGDKEVSCAKPSTQTASSTTNYC